MSEGDFFQDAPEAPAPESRPAPAYRHPDWVGPPDNFRPTTAALDLTIVDADDLALWTDGARAYPQGLLFALDLSVRTPERAEIRGDPFFAEPASDRLRFGLLMADGTRAVAAVRRSLDPPAPPVLTPRGGVRTALGSYHYDFWLWPLPPAGPLTFVLRWPALGSPETRATIPADPIREAAAHAVKLWPDDRPLWSPEHRQ